jgi:hypothetical protein
MSPVSSKSQCVANPAACTVTNTGSFAVPYGAAYA